ncbi:hypothetical protein U1737_06795 [Sphingomonas sp. LB3N6]|uniref:hypothetical protein n=1 Tax=Sphingomonas fucosidasi TaxID=3096164 RepID=UPI002FC7CCE7
MTGWFLAIAFAPSVFWLARRVIAAGESKEEIRASPLQVQAVLGSFLIALALGAPTFNQISYVVGLPLAVITPVIVSMLAWVAVVAVFWMAFIQRTDAQHIFKATKGRASLLAALIGVPKILIVGSWVLRAP